MQVPNELYIEINLNSGLIQQPTHWQFFVNLLKKTGFDIVMQIVSIGDNLHEMSNPVFWENKKNILKCRLLKFYPEC